MRRTQPRSGSWVTRGFNSFVSKTKTTEPVSNTIIQFTSDERHAALLLARYLGAVPVFQQVPGSKATSATTRLETLKLIVGDDWQEVRDEPMGEEVLPSLTRLVDEAATHRAGPTTTAAPATTRPPSTAGNAPAPSTTATPAPTVQATPTTVTPATPEQSGIIGRPPADAVCTPFEQPR